MTVAQVCPAGAQLPPQAVREHASRWHLYSACAKACSGYELPAQTEGEAGVPESPRQRGCISAATGGSSCQQQQRSNICCNDGQLREGSSFQPQALCTEAGESTGRLTYAKAV